MTCLSLSVCRAKFSIEFVTKNAPAKCFYGAFVPSAFHENPVLATSKLVIVLVARILLLRILEVLIQLRRRRDRRRFHPFWIFPHSPESWFEIHLHQCHFIQSHSLRNPHVAKFDDQMTDGCQRTNDFLA